MKQIITAFCLLATLAFLPGCQSVTSDHLIGEAVSVEAAEEFNGVWRLDDGIFLIHHEEDGGLAVAAVEWSDGEFELNEFEVVLTRHHDMLFAHLFDEEDDHDKDEGHDDHGEHDDDEHGHNHAHDDSDHDGHEHDADHDDEDQPMLVLGMVTHGQDDTIVIFAVDFDAFAQAMEDGKIEAALEDDDNTLHIQGEKEDLDALVAPEQFHELFRLTDPGVMIRVGDVD